MRAVSDFEWKEKERSTLMHLPFVSADAGKSHHLACKPRSGIKSWFISAIEEDPAVEPLIFRPLNEEIAAEIPPGKKEEGSSHVTLYQPLTTLCLTHDIVLLSP
ncbi:hypothetical protein NL676_001293 [Syzygium grande]|nr:hypothetical protein NL676_001293 [Syzygium grande]